MNDNVVRLFTLDIKRLSDENALLKKKIGKATKFNVVMVAGMAFVIFTIIHLDKQLDKEFDDIYERLDALETPPEQ